MRITDLLDKRSISLNGAPKSKEEALDQVVALMTKSGKINDEEAYRKQVYAREEESTTGIGEGIAIPHGKCDAVDRPGLAAMVVKNGVDFDARFYPCILHGGEGCRNLQVGQITGDKGQIRPGCPQHWNKGHHLDQANRPKNRRHTQKSFEYRFPARPRLIIDTGDNGIGENHAQRAENPDAPVNVCHVFICSAVFLHPVNLLSWV